MNTQPHKFFIKAVFWLWIGFPGEVVAQEKDIKFHHLTVQDGLPSNTVNAVIRDSRGFIWIASENGVSRYDGYSFINFRSHERDSISISSNVTYVVFEDRKQRLWVGSEKGLDLFNRDLDRFDRHYFKGLPVRSIYQDQYNNLWVGSDYGLYRYDEREKIFSRPFAHLFNSHNLAYNTIPTITEDHFGNLWIGTSNSGIYVYNFEHDTFRHFEHNEKRPGSLSNNDVREILCDRSGRIWIGTYGGGVNLFEVQTETFKTFAYSRYSTSGISSNLIPALGEDESGKIWIGTDGGGLDIIDPENNRVHHVVHSPYNSKSLNNNVVRSISSDGRGGIWMGTYAGGVNFFNQNTEAFFHYKLPTYNGNSSVTSFAEEKGGNLWIGTDGGGLCYFNRSTRQFLNFHHNEKNTNSLSDNRILSLLLDHKGMLWIGTYFGGLCRYDPNTKVFVRYTDTGRSLLSDNVVWTLLEDSKKRIWAGTNKGLNLYDPVNDVFRSINISNSNLSNSMIRSMHEDRKKRLWIGTQEGLNLWNEDHNHFTVFKNDPRQENSLSHDWVRAIHEDGQGNIWVGTFEGGLNLYDERTGSFRIFKESDGLPDNIISGILSDPHDNIWVSTGRGLARIDMKAKKIRNYYVNDGLQDNQFNINACFNTQQGEFLFGGINGFTLFLSDMIRQADANKFPPPIALTSFKIFNREVVPGQAGSPLTRHINETRAIQLTYNQHVLTFEFSALNFIRQEKNEYAYRLIGFEEEWNYVGNKRSATYTNLDPGRYLFQVKASNNAGVWNEKGISISVVIMPPFWETWWFYTIIGLLILLLALFIFDVVSKRIREKIRISRRIAELEIRALITQMNPHFIFNCLTSIEELIMMKKQQEAMHYLNQFSRLLRTVLQSSEKNFISLEQELTLLESYLELEAMRFDKQFHYRINISDEIDPEEIVIPSFLTQPFVENALWHGLMHKKGERNLTVSFAFETEDILLCKIQDNGIGREQAKKIKKNPSIHKSMGIKIIRERMKLMKEQNDAVDLQIIDNINELGNPEGTVVIIKLPVSVKMITIPSSKGMEPVS